MLFIFFLAKRIVPFPVFSQQKQKRRGKFSCFGGLRLEPKPTFFQKLEKKCKNFKGSEQGCPWPFRPDTWSEYSYHDSLA